MRTTARNGWTAAPRRVPEKRFTWRLLKVYLIEIVGNLFHPETGQNAPEFTEKVYIKFTLS